MNQDEGDTHGDRFGMSVKEAWKDIAFGSIAGMVAEVFDYPFDLAKVRLQSQLLHSVEGGSTPVFKGPLDCLSQTWKEEGLRGLYRGLSVPLVGSMAQTAGLFLVYSSFQRAIQNYYHPHSGRDRDHRKLQLTIPQVGVASASAGFLTSFILTPMELVKCRLQVQMMNMHSQQLVYHPKAPPTSPTVAKLLSPTRPATFTSALLATAPIPAIHNSTTARTPSPPTRGMSSLSNTFFRTTKPPGALSIVRSIFRDHGLKGFWLGQTGTMVRETGGCAIWFVVKEVVADTLQKRRGGLQFNGETASPDYHPPRPAEGMTNITPWESAIAGATAGAAATLLFYPVDTIKSAIQTEEELRPSSRRVRTTSSSTFSRAAFKMYRAHGLKSFYSGCGMTVARSVPSGGIIFVVYDGLRQWFDQD